MGFTNSPLATYKNLTKNYSSGRGGQSDITRITPHCIVGQWTAKQGADYFATTDRECSSNYIVGKTGDIALSVEEKNRSWCSSSRDNDNRAITIECASDANAPYAFTTACYNALVELCVDICKRYGKKKLLWFSNKTTALNYQPKSDEVVLTVHRWFANKSCPGDWMYSRMGNLAEAVTKRLGSTTTTQPTTPTPSTDELYRVRKDWKDAKSQIGAYKVLDNAKKQADKNAGYKVFDSKGNVVYPVEVKPTTPIQTTDNAKTIWNFFKAKGLNDFAIAGIMGNLNAESALKPTNLQQTYEKKLGMDDATYTAAVDNGSYTNFVKDSAGYGLAQWTYWSRKDALLKYAKQVGKSIGDLTMQLEFMWNELQNYTSVMKVLKSATSIRQASDVILTQYERPANQSESVKLKRASYGENYYKKFAGTTTETPTPVKPELFKPYTVRVSISDLNIRKGPGTNYGKNGFCPKGVYTIVEEADGKGATKWGKLKSGVGWISLDYAKKR